MSCEVSTLKTDRAFPLNWEIRRNDSIDTYITMLINGTPYDFTNYDVATMQVKTDTETDTVIFTASIANSKLTLGTTDGKITFDFSDDDMDIEPNAYIYDLEIYSTSLDRRETILKGNFIVNPDITRV